VHDVIGDGPHRIQRDIGGSTSFHPMHDVYYSVIWESKGAILRSAIEFVFLNTNCDNHERAEE